jgi:serine acetyltransferase
VIDDNVSMMQGVTFKVAREKNRATAIQAFQHGVLIGAGARFLATSRLAIARALQRAR